METEIHVSYRHVFYISHESNIKTFFVVVKLLFFSLIYSYEKCSSTEIRGMSTNQHVLNARRIQDRWRGHLV